MNTVEPIRDINTVWDIADYLGEKSERNKIMFLFGIYVGIRVSDILSLKVRDVRDMNYVSIREMKTGKEKRFPINEELRPLLNRKTFGYHFYQQTHDIVTLQKIFNHDNTHITMRYIGLEQDAISESIMKLSFKKRR